MLHKPLLKSKILTLKKCLEVLWFLSRDISKKQANVSNVAQK